MLSCGHTLRSCAPMLLGTVVDEVLKESITVELLDAAHTRI